MSGVGVVKLFLLPDKARESLLDQGLVECLLPFLLSSGHALPYQVSEVQSATLAVLTTIAEQG